MNWQSIIIIIIIIIITLLTCHYLACTVNASVECRTECHCITDEQSKFPDLSFFTVSLLNF